MERDLADPVQVDDMYVSLHLSPVSTAYAYLNTLAFFGIIDLLSVLPYYIEILMQQDTVSLVITSCSVPDPS